ncbi:hypothetical protein [Marinobacter arenosus]|uniref:hypothetical protein n=1 Tax=Marinobacter arenosus TaxID=2856822 RepID=UPI001C4D1694|nr:hypothetical protein [Marinobacter arenosus]MBW0148025.1 hypothetical protein [Marinobacter arenosus]
MVKEILGGEGPGTASEPVKQADALNKGLGGKTEVSQWLRQGAREELCWNINGMDAPVMKEKTVVLAYMVAVGGSVLVAFLLWLSLEDKFTFISLVFVLIFWYVIKTVFIYLTALFFH